MNTKQFVFLVIIYQYTFYTGVTTLEVPKHMVSGVKKLTNICIKESGASEDLFKDIRATGELPNNQNLKCFMHCVLDKIGLIDDDNIVHLDNLIEIMPPDFVPIIEQLHTTCGTKSGADGCETAFLTIECYIKKEPIISKMLFSTFAD
ncbi:general odorant-binding protein 69a [Bactrocera dorsalis]|uniref:Odorant-binding protein n=1 Tax=Bactrocera dorsalis TaxID=27457 RepID=A0A0G2UEV0_BACDO|nr:general odorant-binding protein 69a [Bactrocera dorsalis]AKI29014.1 odorant binding protein 69a [Bactrocera dorsalis]QKN21329.1 odorant-binding protein [Bactrocera dorsalis]